MEYCEGAQVNDVEYIKDNNISVNEVRICFNDFLMSLEQNFLFAQIKERMKINLCLQ